MILRNLYSVTHDKNVEVYVSDGFISDIWFSGKQVVDAKAGPSIEFNDAIVFPGLINSHDHLDFNLFPRLGNRAYNNYVEWGQDIHNVNKDVINKVLQVPHELRLQWGIYKNLLNGITTVVNHGPRIAAADAPVSVFQDCHVLHSVRLEKNWAIQLNKPGIQKFPFVVHIGEGTDTGSYEEIQKLLRWNLFKRELIGIHGVAMDAAQAKNFRAIVWCPDSNLFLLGKIADIAKLKKNTIPVFGTDSTVSASWNIWEQLALAKNSNMVSDHELYDMLTANAAKAWRLDHAGALEPGKTADLVVAKRKDGKSGLSAFFATRPEDILMVLKNGEIVYFDETLQDTLQQAGFNLKGYGRVLLNGNAKFVQGSLPGLIRQIKACYPEAEMPVDV